MTQGQSVPAYELHWGDRWYDLWLEPLGAEAAPATWPQGVVVLLEDITERKTMETALRQLN